MARPGNTEWSILGYDHDPTPGDPDAVSEIGQDLRDLAGLIWRQAAEIESLCSVESWQSKAAEKFKHTAQSAVADLRKAFHRYDIAAKALGTSTEGSGYAAELDRAQTMADSALRDAENAHAERVTLQQQHHRMPSDTKPTDPQAVGLSRRIQTANDTIDHCRHRVANAVGIQETAAQRAQAAIHRAITHDGFHDKFGDKFEADVGSIASTVWGGVKNFAENVGNIAASTGNAALHDPGSDLGLMGGLFLTSLGAAGEGVGFALDATVVGSAAGVPINLASGWLIAVGGTTALAAAGKVGWDAAHTDRVQMTADGGGGGGGDTDGELSNLKRPPRAEDNNYVVHNPADHSDTITDIDHVGKDGRLWEEKSATATDPPLNEAQINKWCNDKVTKKLNSYLRARQYLSGYENADFGLSFTEPGAAPQFKQAVEDTVQQWQEEHPGVDVKVTWAS